MRNEKFVYLILLLSFLGCENEIVNSVPSIPVVKILSPKMNSVISENTEITVEATDDNKIIRVEVYVNSILKFKSDSSKTLYSFEWYPSYSDVEGSQYIIEAVAYDDDGNKSGSQAIITKFFKFTPYLIGADILKDSLFKINWTDNSKIETGFEVEIAVNDSNFTLITIADSNATFAYVEYPIQLDSSYRFRVRAIGKSTKSSYSRIVNSNIFLTAPVSISAQLMADSMIAISWVDTNIFESGFSVRVSNSGKIVPKDSFSTTMLFNFVRGMNYTVSVSAYHVNVFSTAKYITVSFSFDVPTNLRTQSEFADKIVLRWDDRTSVEKGFIIFRGANAGGLAEIARVNANITDYTDLNLDTNFSFKYSVKAFTDRNQSLESNRISVEFQPSLVSDKIYSFPKNFREGTFSGNFLYFFKNKNRTVSMYSIPSMSLVRDFAEPPDSQYGPYPEIVASYDGSKVSRGFSISYSGSGSGNRLGIWDAASGALQDYFNTSCFPGPIAFTLENNKVIFSRCQSVVSHWIPGGTVATTFTNQSPWVIANMKKNLLYATTQGFIRIYKMDDASLVNTITTPYRDFPLGFSIDGQYFVSNSSGLAAIYDINTGAKILSVSVNVYNLRRAHVTEDQKYLILIGQTEMSLFNIQTQKLVKKYFMNGDIYHSGLLEGQNKLAIALQTNLTYYKFAKSWIMIPS